MAIIYKRLINGTQAGTGIGTAYSSPANTKAVIQQLTVTNNTAGAITFTLYLTGAGVAAGSANMVLNAKALGAGETYSCPEAIGTVLEATGSIACAASAGTSASIQASGLEVQ